MSGTISDLSTNELFKQVLLLQHDNYKQDVAPFIRELRQRIAERPVTERKERCETCRFCDDGFCHRYPPQVFGHMMEGKPADQGYFPVVERIGSAWCGEWKPLKKSGSPPPPPEPDRQEPT